MFLAGSAPAESGRVGWRLLAVLRLEETTMAAAGPYQGNPAGPNRPNLGQATACCDPDECHDQGGGDRGCTSPYGPGPSQNRLAAGGPGLSDRVSNPCGGGPDPDRPITFALDNPYAAGRGDPGCCDDQPGTPPRQRFGHPPPQSRPGGGSGCGGSAGGSRCSCPSPSPAPTPTPTPTPTPPPTPPPIIGPPSWPTLPLPLPTPTPTPTRPPP